MKNKIVAAAKVPLALVLLLAGWALWLLDDLIRLVRRDRIVIPIALLVWVTPDGAGVQC